MTELSSVEEGGKVVRGGKIHTKRRGGSGDVTCSSLIVPSCRSVDRYIDYQNLKLKYEFSSADKLV
jgi:hypothetical protein